MYHINCKSYFLCITFPLTRSLKYQSKLLRAYPKYFKLKDVRFRSDLGKNTDKFCSQMFSLKKECVFIKIT